MSVASSSARPGTQPTKAELRVLRAWRDARSARLAARRLGMTQAGVEAMLANIRARAGVKRTWEAVHIYLS